MRIIFWILTILFILTPGTAYASTIKINEFYAAGGSSSSNPDWVEIYNEGMDISLYQLIDADNHKKDLSNVSCNGHFCTIDWYNLLNKDGDIITLTSKLYPDIPIDQVKYGSYGGISAPGSGQSAGRNPDITGNWIISSLPTKGEPNNPSTPIPTQTPASTPSTISTSTPQSISSFTISNIPSQINSDQSFSVLVNLSSPGNPSTNFYLKGAFKKADSSNYFGLTKVSGSWIKNSSSSSSQYSITTDNSGNWSTDNLEMMPDADDSGYTGSDDYVFKVGRYDKDGGNLTWSNEVTISINDIGGVSSNSPSPQFTPKISPSTSLTKLQSPSPKPTPSTKISYQIASVAGIETSATPEGEVKVKNQKQTNPFLWIGLIFIFAGTGAVGYIYLKKNAKIRIKF